MEVNGKEVGQKLLDEARQLKEPLAAKRLEIQERYGEIKRLYLEQTQEVDKLVRELNEKILPIDKLINEAAQLKKLNGRAAEILANEIITAIEGMRNDRSNES